MRSDNELMKLIDQLEVARNKECNDYLKMIETLMLATVVIGLIAFAAGYLTGGGY